MLLWIKASAKLVNVYVYMAYMHCVLNLIEMFV